jgi:hypothetical protein
MSLMQLFYASMPFGFDNPTLNNILATSRRNNMRDNITGSLVVRGDIYLQLLEGPRDAVTKTFQRILSDDRHADVVLIGSGDIKVRQFGNWAMRHDPARTWMWTQDEVGKGAVDATSAEDVRAIFRRLIEEVA